MRSDCELVCAVQQGDRAAYAELVRRYEKTVLAAAMRIVGDFHTAEDVTQNTFVKAYENLGSLRDGRSLVGWLVKIAQRLALTERRRKRPNAPLDAAPEPAAFGRDGMLDDESKVLLRAVMKLPAHERSVVLLHYFDGHSIPIVADLTGRPVGTITQQLCRARARLRMQLQELKP
jgi:RNA polymerase sigma-70 factor, ECF subfamily